MDRSRRNMSLRARRPEPRGQVDLGLVASARGAVLEQTDAPAGERIHCACGGTFDPHNLQEALMHFGPGH